MATKFVILQNDTSRDGFLRDNADAAEPFPGHGFGWRAMSARVAKRWRLVSFRGKNKKKHVI